MGTSRRRRGPSGITSAARRPTGRRWRSSRPPPPTPGRRSPTLKVLERLPGFTHVRLKLETGRTHQIRVQMAYAGHPVAGGPGLWPREGHHRAGRAVPSRQEPRVYPPGDGGMDGVYFAAPRVFHPLPHQTPPGERAADDGRGFNGLRLRRDPPLPGRHPAGGEYRGCTGLSGGRRAVSPSRRGGRRRW